MTGVIEIISIYLYMRRGKRPGPPPKTSASSRLFAFLPPWEGMESLPLRRPDLLTYERIAAPSFGFPPWDLGFSLPSGSRTSWTTVPNIWWGDKGGLVR